MRNGQLSVGVVLLIAALMGLVFGLGALWGGAKYEAHWMDAGCVCQ
ncbi:MAG: hypothetical protein MUF54_07940 [Polyangiaceae bacterium]|nr:hypothetical protein [Polyangiaceae bacterium]